MYQIIINDIVLDGIVPGQSIAITKALNNLNDIASRQGAFSTQIKVVKTNLNKSVFENSHIIGSPTNVPYTRLPARIDEDGITQIIGFAQLEQSDEYYNFRIYGSSSDFYNLVKDKPLYELNFSRFNHLWVSANIGYNRTNVADWNDAFVYADIDYGKWTLAASNQVKMGDFYPAIFVKMIIYQMCIDVGFVPNENDFWLNDSIFASEILPFCSVHPKFSKLYQKSRKLKLSTNATFPCTPGTRTQLLLTGIEDNWGGNYNSGTGELTFDENVMDLDGDFYIKYFINISGGFVNWPYLFFYATTDLAVTTLFPTGTNYRAFLYSIPQPISATTGGYYGEARFSLSELGTNQIAFRQPAKGTKLKFYAFCYDPFGTTVTFDILSGSSFTASVGDNAYPGSKWDIASNLPDMSCGDLLTTIVNQFGLLIDANSWTKTVKLVPFKTIEANKAIAPDWSDKVRDDKANRLTYLFQNYGQKSQMRYSMDESDPYLKPIPDYGNGFFNVNDATLDPAKVSFESKFAPVYRMNSFLNATVKPMAFISMFDIVTLNSKSPKSRIAYLKIINDGGDGSVDLEQDTDENVALFIFGTGGGAVTNPGRSLAVFFDDLRFNESLIPTYYQPLQSILDHTKSPLLSIDLSKKDFVEIDFSIPVYLDCWLPDFGQIVGYFYINLIDQYGLDANDPTMVELVRI